MTAVIEGQCVQYQLKLLDELAPLLSVAVLLAAHHLGADPVRAASRMADFLPYGREGVLCKIACGGSAAELFVSAAINTATACKAFFQTSGRLTTAARRGRKILVLGSINQNSGESRLDPATLARCIDEAEADLIILLGPQMQAVQDHLPHPDRVVRVFPEFGRRHARSVSVRPLLEAVDDLLRPADLLLIAGEVPELAAHVRKAAMHSSAQQMRTDRHPAHTGRVDPGPVVHPIPYIRDRNGIRSLHLDSAVRQSVMRVDQPDALLWEYTRHMMGWLLFVDPDSVIERHAMQLGLGAGSLTKACRKRLEMRTTAIELNPAVIKLCRSSFALPPDDDKLRVIEGDAVHQLCMPEWQEAVDALQVDLFDEKVSAPIFDDECFFSDCRAVLTRDGCITFNVVGRASSVAHTFDNMSQVFGRLALWSFARCATGNTVVMAQCLPSRPSRRTLQLRAREIQRRWGFSATEWVDSLESWVL